jgi:hypothetical protein
LYTEAASPHVSQRAAQYKRIADRIDAKYGAGDYDTAGEDVFDMAQRVFRERQALKERYRARKTHTSIDDLLRRLQQ